MKRQFNFFKYMEIRNNSFIELKKLKGLHTYVNPRITICEKTGIIEFRYQRHKTFFFNEPMPITEFFDLCPLDNIHDIDCEHIRKFENRKFYYKFEIRYEDNKFVRFFKKIFKKPIIKKMWILPHKDFIAGIGASITLKELTPAKYEMIKNWNSIVPLEDK